MDDAENGLIPAPDPSGSSDSFPMLHGVPVAPLGASADVAKVNGQEISQDPALHDHYMRQGYLNRRNYERWHDQFFAVLRATRNVSKASAAVGIHRKTAYNLRKRCKDFRKRWEDTEDYALDRIEEAVLKVAAEGEVEPVLKEMWVETPEGPKKSWLPVHYKRKFHPQLALEVLKRTRPQKWGEEISDEQAGDAALKIGRAFKAMEGVSLAQLEPQFEPDTTQPKEEGDEDGSGQHAAQLRSPYRDP